MESFFHDFNGDKDLIDSYNNFVEYIKTSEKDKSLANILEKVMKRKVIKNNDIFYYNYFF